MQVETLADVLEWTRSVHRRLADCLEHCAAGTSSERVRMLMGYLSAHERELDRVLALSKEDASRQALDTWVYDYFEKAPIQPHEICSDSFRDKSTEEVLAQVLAMHDQVTGLYRYLQGRAEVPSTRALVDSLLALEQQEARRLVTQAHRLDDL